MIKKSGFTLIEIIVVICLITCIGVISFIGFKVSSDNNIKLLNDKVLDAASIFASIEKDNNGNIYIKAVENYAKGVKIPLQTLVDKGYIDETVIKQIYKHNNYTEYNNSDYYVLLANEKNYCETGASYILSWTMTENTPIYLCDTANYSDNDSSLNIINIIRDFPIIKTEINYMKAALSNEYCNNNTCDENLITNEENGLYYYENKKVDERYFYFRGGVEDNYIVYGKDENGNDILWRILWVNDKGTMKLVLDHTIPITFKKNDGNYITAKAGDYIFKMEDNKRYLVSGDPNYVNKAWTVGCEYKGCGCGYPFHEYNNSYLLSDEYNFSVAFTNSMQYGYNNSLEIIRSIKSRELYITLSQEWFETKVYEKNEDILKTENNFCFNGTYWYQGNTGTNFAFPHQEIVCATGKYETYPDYRILNNPSYISWGDTSNYKYDSNVGLLTSGEAVMAGLSISSNGELSSIDTGANFLASDNKYMLSEFNVLGANVGTTVQTMNKNAKLVNHHIILGDYSYCGVSEGATYYRYYDREEILADALKPTITIDYNKIKMSGNGTKDIPYMMIKK